ncbi:polyketide synthase dehydratase domain-containing protein, partial [Candidatus Sumerlaeota bacterium]|nr:polyketide synthase dehydratase domain-containing protein [Candidatus Sumerlaeota bacterium]
RREASVRKTLEEIRRDEGPIRGLIHGAGILADALIEKKTAEQFSSVFDTKVKGLRALLRAMSGDDLEFLTLFSSASGRFGRAGQVDYAVANEVLNKVARQQSQARPDCRVMAINWGPWDGGMVTPGLRELFLSEGIGLIPLEAGARFLVEELNSPPDGAIEIIVGVHPRPTVGDRPIHRNGSKKFATSFERAIDLENCRFLNSHVIGGKPVMPLSMLVEWLAHGALHDNPGFIFHGFNDLRVLKGLRLENGDPYPIRVLASKAEHGETGSTVSVELRGGDSLATLHARAEVILGPNLPPQTPGRIALSPTPPYSRSIDSVYRDVLFHGELLRGIQEIESLSEEGIVAKLASAPAPDSWMTEPPRSSWLSDPLALDAAIQLILLWTYEHHGQVSLPSFAGKYRQFRTAFPKHGVKAVVRTEKNGGNIAMADIDFLDDAGELIARMERCECVMDPSLFDAFRRRSVIPSPLT